MKRMITIARLFSLAALIFGFSVMQSQAQRMANPSKAYPFTENFESATFPPAGWAVHSLPGAQALWVQGVMNHTPEGSYAALHSYASGQSDGWLVTPAIDFPVEGQFFLSFWSLNLDASYYSDGKNSVLVSTGSPDPLSGDFVEVWTTPEVTDSWVQTVVNLEAYAGQQVYIAFRYEGNFAHVWFVDDIELGLEMNTNPVIQTNITSLTQKLVPGIVANKSLIVKNNGFEDLVYTISFSYDDAKNNWLNIQPLSGTATPGQSITHQLSLNSTGLELGLYHASITINSNDPETPELVIPVILEVADGGMVTVTNIVNDFTFPSGISEDGMYVSGLFMGVEGGYFWKAGTGTTTLLGNPYGVANNGIVGGTYMNTDLAANAAGRWNHETQSWTFLGINPQYPNLVGEDYSIGYGISGDSKTVVGMQYVGPWQVKAFKWHQDNGYIMIGGSIPFNSRPNGISADGTVIYGWADTDNINRTPVIWYGDDIIYINADQSGEAFGASPNGQFVTGTVGMDCFIWSPDKGVTLFENTLNEGIMATIIALNDGSVLGYTNENWPPFPDGRRAFIRDPQGNMSSFNDYAEGRGMVDAQEWLFFTMSAATPDANKFAGAALNPQGDAVTILIDFESTTPTISVMPASLAQELNSGETAAQVIEVSNTGTGVLNYNAVIQYVDKSKAVVKEVPKGKRAVTTGMKVAKSDNPRKVSSPVTAKDGVVINYDGPNNGNAVGISAGGTFFSNTRYTSAMLAPYEGYEMESIDVYILSQPISLKLIIRDAGTESSPGAILHEQEVSVTANSWNTITLSQPMVLSGADLWVGFECTHDAGVYSLGVDGGPANPNAGWLSMDALTWERMMDYQIDANWNTRLLVKYAGINWLNINPASASVQADESIEITASFNATGMQGGVYTANIVFNSNDYQGTQVIVPVTLTVNAVYYTLDFVVTDGQGVSITDAVISANGTTNQAGDYSFEVEPGTYAYTVTKDGFFPVTGEVEMGYENQTVNVVIFGTSITEENPNQISIFPNPAKENTMVEAPFEMKEIRLFNLAGQLQRTFNVADFRHQINLSGLENGVYLLQIVTTQNVFNKQIQVIK